MTRKKILGSHVKRLLSGVSDHGRAPDRSRDRPGADRLLLEEAIEKLTFSFMAIHQAVDARQESDQPLLAGGIATPEQRAQLTGMSGEIGGTSTPPSPACSSRT
jgi:hypothetical protein